MTEIGFTIAPQQIFTSLIATRMLVERERLIPYLMLEDSAVEDFVGLDYTSGKPNAVVVGTPPSV